MGDPILKQALAIWAKSGKPYHPLLGHMLDTAAVVLAILEREPARTRELFRADWDLEEEKALRLTAFLAGLHDLGKASPVFQAAWEDGANRVKAAGLGWKNQVTEKSAWVGHWVLTVIFAKDELQRRGLDEEKASKIAQALGAHHGFLASQAELQRAKKHRALEEGPWEEVRSLTVYHLAQALDLQGPFPKGENLGPSALLRIMALASFADWIASDPKLFPYGRDPSEAGPYLKEALKLAKKALDRLGWRRVQGKEKLFRALFPFEPNPLQAAVAELLEGEGPFLLLVEAPMGMGKTEAALYASHLLEARLGHRGFYFALPTQATSNGLFPRVQGFLKKAVKGRVELQLQHGTALLNPAYQELSESLRPRGVHDKDQERGEAVASAWFSARKRAMLAPFGVGTLDQALLGVLKVKHHFVRLFGVMNRVVVLDEIHAYDVYTSTLLETLLTWLRDLGSSVILMTATLPKVKRQALLEAWGFPQGANLGTYPRVVALDTKGKLRVRKIPPHREVEVRLEEVPVEVEALAERLREALPGVLGAIVNTVDRAQALYKALGPGHPVSAREFGKDFREGVVGKRLEDGTLALLLHARFPAEERALRERVVLKLFGQEGPRPERALLVATQVAEQSLDLDLDLLYTDLAPIDLIFQRVGRLHRHKRRRPKDHQAPCLLWGYPEGLDFGQPLYWDQIYEKDVLRATLEVLKGRGSLRIPQDLEALLEAVYTPLPSSEKAERDRKTAENWAVTPSRLLDLGNTADLAREFGLEDEVESEKTQRLLTRLGEPSVAVVPVYRQNGGYSLDREGRQPVPLEGNISQKVAEALFQRAVRLSRKPIPQTLAQDPPPKAWQKSPLLRHLKLLEVGRRFGRTRVALDPELGVVYEVDE